MTGCASFYLAKKTAELWVKTLPLKKKKKNYSARATTQQSQLQFKNLDDHVRVKYTESHIFHGSLRDHS